MRSKHFLPELEGIRGYAFLIVFLVHYTYSLALQPAGPGLLRYAVFLLAQISWVAVPIFFVLSGFLITGILYDTRYRQGFFSVFYQRRAVRILPLYYFVLGLYALLSWATSQKMPLQQLWFLVYLQNLPSLPMTIWGNKFFTIGHLWSLAVEEQFYILWPVVIWLLPHRKSLLRFCYAAIAVSAITRLVWPLVHLSPEAMYTNLVTRGDAIMLGAALALHSRRAGFDMKRLHQPALWVLALSVLLLYTRVFIAGNALPRDFIGIAFMNPIINVIAACIIVLTLAPGSLLHRACRIGSICSLGSMSYSLYLLHGLLYPLIQVLWAPRLARQIGHPASRAVIIIGTGAITYAASWLCYRFFELPAVRARDRFRYGPEIPPKVSRTLTAPASIFGLTLRRAPEVPPQTGFPAPDTEETIGSAA